MRAPITLDLHITNFNYPDVPPERLFDHVCEMARTAEDNGFSSVSVMDHLHQIGVVGPPGLNMLEGNMALAGIAARTSRASVGLLVGGGGYSTIQAAVDAAQEGDTIVIAAGNYSENVTIGSRTGGFYFQGRIDELRIYTRALTTAEIQADMNAAVPASTACN